MVGLGGLFRRCGYAGRGCKGGAMVSNGFHISNPSFRQVAVIRKRPVVELSEPLTMKFDFGNGCIYIRVPSGFRTDFASIPRPLWWLLPPMGEYTLASIVHDFACETPSISRFLGDAIFREAMSQLGVPWYRRLAMYYSVRLYAVLARKR